MSARFSCDDYENSFQSRGRVCVRCVMDESDPQLTFDESGRCSACIHAEASRPAWMVTDAERAPTFDETVAAIKRENPHRDFDTILGLSGGVDSSWALVRAAEAGLRVMVMHCDTGWDSRESVDNIFTLCRKLKLELETVVIDWEAMRAAQRAFFLAGVANCDIPQDHAIIASVNIVAARCGVRTFISGGNWASESILPKAWGHDALDIVHLRDIWKRGGQYELIGRFPTMGRVKRHFVNPIVRRMHAWRVLNDLRYDPLEARRRLQTEYGWTSYGGKHCESVFTRVFQTVYLPMRFGFDKRRPHLASLIMSGLATREQALQELAETPMTQVDAERDVEYLCSKLGFSAEDWRRIVTSPPIPHSAYRTDHYERMAVGFAKRYITPHINLRRIT
jgi:N-acetyl sugar amidotransferase